MSSILIDLHYLPSISYFSKISKYKTVILEDRENFQRQTYRNRARILGANGSLNLSIPLNHKSARNISKTKISYTDNWSSVHVKSIESAYRRSPFYDYYSEEILLPIQSKKSLLWDLNYDILSILSQILNLECEFKKASDTKEKKVFDADDFRNKIKPKKSLFTHETSDYQQVFSKSFTPDLSIIDLIFCTGPESVMYL